MKTCYYELLDVEVTATDNELKKAYRKKALLLHPDKNPHDVEGANARFALVRAAYEVLSDSQERAWYDSHKSEILRDDDDYVTDEPQEMVIPSISVQEILRYFNPSLYGQMDDSQAGFYSVASRLFERLAAEEVTHGKYQQLPKFDKHMDDSPNVSAIDESFLLFPRLGNSHTDYASGIRTFYNSWGSFLSVKSFNWMDEYRYSAAPDRRTRRLMEKENKKARDAARKEYNETVRRFVGFIKKRDPRVKKGAEEYENSRRRQQQESLERQAKEQKLQRIADMNNHEIQDWQKMDMEELELVEEMLRKEFDYDSDETTDSEFDEFEDQLNEEFYECVVCNKFFKSKSQFETHESSNKHKLNVEQLREEMLREGIELGIDKDDIDLSEFETASSGNEDGYDMENEKDENENEKEKDEEGYVEGVVEDFVDGNMESEVKLESLGNDKLYDFDVDDDIDSEDEIIESSWKSKKQKKKSKKQTSFPPEEVESNPLDDDLAKLVNGVSLDKDEDWADSKKKKKPKRRAGLEKTGSPSPAPVPDQNSQKSVPVKVPNGSEICAVCKEIFTSRNKLFQHVKKSGHAAPVKEVKKGKGKRK